TSSLPAAHDAQDLRALVRPIRREIKLDARPAADRAGVAAVQQAVPEDKALAPGRDGVRLEHWTRFPEHQPRKVRLERLEAVVALERNIHLFRIDDDRIPTEEGRLLVL